MEANFHKDEEPNEEQKKHQAAVELDNFNENDWKRRSTGDPNAD